MINRKKENDLQPQWVAIYFRQKDKNPSNIEKQKRKKEDPSIMQIRIFKSKKSGSLLLPSFTDIQILLVFCSK